MSDLLSTPWLYRIWRLRRSLALGLALPLAALGAIGALTGARAGVVQPWLALPLMLLWAAALLAHAVRFPKAIAEQVVFSAALALTILVSPGLDWLAAQASGPLQPPHYFGLGALALCLWIAALVGTDLAFARLARRSRRRMRHRSTRLRSDLPPDRVMACLMPAPNRETPVRRYGTADPAGRMPVWMVRPGAQPAAPLPTATGAGPAPWGKPSEPDYWLQVIEATPTSLAMVAALSTGATETARIGLTADKGGTLISYVTREDVLTGFESFVFSLGDVSADFLETLLEEARGLSRPRTIWPLVPETLGSRLMASSRDDTPNAPR